MIWNSFISFIVVEIFRYIDESVLKCARSFVELRCTLKKNTKTWSMWTSIEFLTPFIWAYLVIFDEYDEFDKWIEDFPGVFPSK